MRNVFIALMILYTSAFAIKDLGTYGKLYPIIEESFMVQIEENYKKIDWDKQKDNFRKSVRESFIAKGNLPLCQKTRTREYVRMNTLKSPIFAADGSILYPVGYTYNVLELMAKNGLVSKKGLLFVDIDEVRQFSYAKEMSVNADIYAVDGDIEIAAKKGFQVEKGDGLIDVMDIQCTPSLYIQTRNHFEILEINNEDLKTVVQSLKEKGI